MKKLLAILIISLTVLSCSKDAPVINTLIPEFEWQYNSPTTNDTTYVSPTDDTFTTLDWRVSGGVNRVVFDSVRVYNDSTFTVNQKVSYWGETISAIGSGSFGTGTLQFFITLQGGGDVIFSGIKY